LVKRLTPSQIHEIKELAKAGTSIAKIAKSLEIGKPTVYYHARQYCKKMTKFDPSLLNESEKGYIVGFFLGDGSFNRGKKTPRYIVRFALDAKRDRDIAKRLAKIFQENRKKVSIFPRENTLIVKVCSKELVGFIQTYINYKTGFHCHKEKILQLDRNCSRIFQYGVLAGIIDSDGHVLGHLGTEIKTVSSSVFEGIINVLNNLGIVAKMKQKRASGNSYSKKSFYVIYLPSLQMRKHKGKIPSVKVTRLPHANSKTKD